MTDRPVLPAPDIEAYVRQHVGGESVTWCGGSAGAAARCSRWPGVKAYEYAYGDIDLFGSDAAIIACAARMIQNGATPLNDSEFRKWKRWNRKGMDPFHTNSLRLATKDEVEFNLVYKKVDNVPLLTPVQQIESFDFSNVSMGVDMEDGQRIDQFHSYWLGENPDQVRMFPLRARQWREATIGMFTGVRQGERYAKNLQREYNMDRCKDPLVQGYRITAQYYEDRYSDSAEHMDHVVIYHSIADLIEIDDWEGLLELYKDVSPLTKAADIATKIRAVP